MANFYTLLVSYSKVGRLYKLRYQCRIFWFKDLAKELLYNFKGYTYRAFFKKLLALWEPKDRRVICQIQSSFFEYFLPK